VPDIEVFTLGWVTANNAPICPISKVAEDAVSVPVPVVTEGVIVTPFIEARGVFYGDDDTFSNRFVLTGGILF